MTELGDKMGERARENVLTLEVKKDALKQNQDGTWVITFRCHPADMPLGLMLAEMGTRYQCALAEVTDADEPKVQTAAKKQKAGKAKPKSLTKEAGRLCGDPRFAEFLREIKRDELLKRAAGKVPPTDVAGCVRLLCQVESRAEFDKDPEAAARWRALHSEYTAWHLTA